MNVLCGLPCLRRKPEGAGCISRHKPSPLSLSRHQVLLASHMALPPPCLAFVFDSQERGEEKKEKLPSWLLPRRYGLRWGSGPESRLALAGRSLVWTAVWALGCYRNGERRCWRRDEPRVLTQQHRDGQTETSGPVSIGAKVNSAPA